MPLILAIEPDRRQASELTAIVRGQLHAELVLGESAERALAALGQRVPDLILTSALLSPKDEAVLGERLRALDGSAVHVQTLTIPVLASSPGRDGRPGGVLFGLRREKTKLAMSDGCDPDVFAEQCREYLERSATERALLSERAAFTAQEAPTVVVAKHAEPASSEEPLVKPWVEALAEPQERLPETHIEPRAAPRADPPANPPVSPKEASSEPAPQKTREPRPRRNALPWVADNSDGPASLLAAVAALEAEEQIPVQPATTETTGTAETRFAAETSTFAAETSLKEQSEPDEPPASTNPFVDSPRRANPFHGILSGENPFDTKPSDTKLSDAKRGGRGHSDALGGEWAEGDEIDLSSLLGDSSTRTRRTHRSMKFEDDQAGAYEIDSSLHPAAGFDSVLPATTLGADPPTPASGKERARTKEGQWPFLDNNEIESAKSTPATPLPPATSSDAPSAFAATAASSAPTQTTAKTELEAMKEWADILEALRRDAELATSQSGPAAKASSASPTPPDVSSDDRGSVNAAQAEGTSASESSYADGSQKKKKRSKGGTAHDEWGFFDPDEYGFSKLIEKLEGAADEDDTPTPKQKPKRA